MTIILVSGFLSKRIQSLKLLKSKRSIFIVGKGYFYSDSKATFTMHWTNFRPVEKFVLLVVPFTGALNDGFLVHTLKTLFRLFRVLLDL